MFPHKTRANLCWNCGYLLDGATAADLTDKTPKAGDLAICFNCGEPGIFQSDMTLRAAMPFDNISEEKRAMIWRMRAYCQARGPIAKKETRQ